jgi:hypothetical protein
MLINNARHRLRVYEFAGDFNPFAVAAPVDLDDGEGTLLPRVPLGPLPDFSLSRVDIQAAILLGTLFLVPLPSQVPTFDPPLTIPPPLVPSSPLPPRSQAGPATPTPPAPVPPSPQEPAQEKTPTKGAPATPSPLSSKTAGKKPAPRPVSARMTTRASSAKKPTEFKVPNREFSLLPLFFLFLQD